MSYYITHHIEECARTNPLGEAKSIAALKWLLSSDSRAVIVKSNIKELKVFDIPLLQRFCAGMRLDSRMRREPWECVLILLSIVLQSAGDSDIDVFLNQSKRTREAQIKRVGRALKELNDSLLIPELNCINQSTAKELGSINDAVKKSVGGLSVLTTKDKKPNSYDHNNKVLSRDLYAFLKPLYCKPPYGPNACRQIVTVTVNCINYFYPHRFKPVTTRDVINWNR